jgi:hypothetical protein
MIIAIIACVALIGMLCVLAFNLATYAVPFMAGLAVFVVLVFLFAALRSPILRIAVALAFAAPAAIAGYELVWGIAREYVPSDIWRQLFCIAGGVFVGVSALLRLMAAGDPLSNQKLSRP